MKILITVAVILAVLGTTVLVMLTGSAVPPNGSLENARQALVKANKAGALRYAETEYRKADELMKRGWMEMARQRGRLPRLRDYSVADSLLQQAMRDAYAVSRSSYKKMSDLRDDARREQEHFHREIVQWRSSLGATLLKNGTEKFLRKAEMAYKTCGRLISEGEYTLAVKELEDGKESLRHLGDIFEKYSNDEALKIKSWRSWVNETLAASRKTKDYAIIVDKTKHKTYLVHAGRLVHTFGCELGHTPQIQKSFAGDGATPEGRYRVTQVKNYSKYYRALLIDYPNNEDERRFRENKSRGLISRGLHIGGFIEIHGSGGRGSDWTNGCVALVDDDMDKLMKFAKKGTPVTIVRKSDLWP